MRAPDPDLLRALRSDLTAADLTVDAVGDLLGPVAAAALRREQSAPAVRVLTVEPALSPREPLAVLVAHLMLGRPTTRAALDRALPALGTDGAERLGLVDPAGRADDDAVRPLVDLRPYASEDAAGPVSWWLASDLGELSTGQALRHDHVLGVGGASTTLAQVTVRDRRRRALDLGTGCGVQALHAARHCDAVVATDLSRRALGFAGFNAALADVVLDLREGSMLEPVLADGPAFDLVVSNPPFVITPPGAGGRVPAGAGARGVGGAADAGPARYTYRDGGRAGDDLVADLVREVGSVLAPGGVAQLLGNWEHRGTEPWQDRVGAWLDASGLDGWVVQREVLDPARYAETWLRDGGTSRERDPAGWDAGYHAWLDDFASRGVEAIGLGLVVLRRPADDGARVTLRRLEEQEGPVRQPLGHHLAAALAAHDWLTAHDDDGVLAARLVVAPDVTEERHHRPGDADPTVVLLRQGGGFGRTVRAGTALAGLVGVCDGELAVGQVVAALADLLDVGPGELAAELLPAVRELVGYGMLVPA